MSGEEQSCNKMLRYCKHDVTLLERLYIKLLPFMRNHPNISVYTDDLNPQCNVCGSDKIRKDGKTRLSAGIYQTYQCNKCGKWFRGRDNLLTKQKRKTLTSNIL